jgi:hypothetical protein
VGYGLGAIVPLIRKGSDWMKALEATNLASGVLAVAVILALFSPLADPARLSVADQVKRLEAGKVSPDKFDFGFLRFESGKVGQQAFEKLARSTDADIARRAQEARKMEDRWDSPKPDVAVDLRIEMLPAGTALPAAFPRSVVFDGSTGANQALTSCTSKDEPCKARLFDLDADGRDELLIAHRFAVIVFVLGDDGKWTSPGTYMPRICAGVGRGDMRKTLETDQFQTEPQRWPGLRSSDSINWTFTPDTQCPGEAVRVDLIPPPPPPARPAPPPAR